MRAFGLVVALATALLAVGISSARADKRVALVIGNSEYAYAPKLRNPTRDAADMAAALQRIGFEVVSGFDLDYAAMRDKVRSFAERLGGGDVGLFYYAGHGFQVGGHNYLLPIDAQLRSASDLDFATIDVDLILRGMEREPRTNIVFLDVCRDNPLVGNLAGAMGSRSSSVGRGLARIETGVGTLIAFATQPGNIALDGDGRNSPFTEALLKHMEQPGVALSDIMIAVRNDVLQKTERKQVPWENSSLTGRFYFLPPAASTPPPPQTQAPVARDQLASLEIAFWDSIKSERNPRLFEAYLNRYPNGEFAAIARINLEELKAAQPKAALPEDKARVTDAPQLQEIRERLFELNYDPGQLDGPITEPARRAIREFERATSRPITGEPTAGLLRSLREVGGLKPWGAIVYSRKSRKWGIAWAQPTRKEAVSSARTSCGPGVECDAEVSFFGTECGAFVYSGSSWSIMARANIEAAKEAALRECQKRGGACRIIATACADGAQRFTAK